MNERIRNVALTSIILVVVSLSYYAVRLRDREWHTSTHPPVSDSITPVWGGYFGEIPREDRVYRQIIGRLGRAGFPAEDNTSSVDILTLELYNPINGSTTDIYYLLSDSYTPIPFQQAEETSIEGKEVSRLLEAQAIYINGYVFILELNGSRKMLKPKGVHPCGGEMPEIAIKARDYIIERVGEDYFDRYFTYWGLGGCTTEDWRYRVGFFYFIQVGNYTGVNEVCLWYDSTRSLIRHNGVPTADNLMPFKVTREEAVEIAAKAARSIRWLDIDAQIHYCDELSDDTPIEKYVWIVSFYQTPRNAMSGSMLVVIVDPTTSKMYESVNVSWHSTP